MKPSGHHVLRRKDAVFILGLALGLVVSRHQLGRMSGAREFQALRKKAPGTAAYLRAFVGLPFPLTFGVLGLSLARLLELQGWVGAERRRRTPLPPYPFDPGKTQLVIGERHNQDGTRSEAPEWMVQPERGMYGSMLVTGAPGAAKTVFARNVVRQLVRLHADSPERKLAMCFIDPKGGDTDWLREECEAAGRGGDFFEIGLEGARCNPLHRPDLAPPAVGSLVREMIVNVQGDAGAEGPFWRDQARELAQHITWLVRLTEGREQTFYDLYKIGMLPKLFKGWLEEAERLVDVGRASAEEVGELREWYDGKLKDMSDQMRISIASTMNGPLSMFSVPAIRQAFCAGPGEEQFRGFEHAIDRGLIVAIRLPKEELKDVADVVGTTMKLNWQSAVLRRLARRRSGRVLGRSVAFVCDEYDVAVSMPADGMYLSKSREAKAVNVLLTQSYEMLLAKLRNPHVVGSLLGNCRTKVWLCAEDNQTSREAAELCGEVDRPKESVQRSETVRGAFSLTDGKVIGASPASVGESRTTSPHKEFLFLQRVFTRLRVGQAVVKMFDGSKVHEPTIVYPKAAHHDPDASWFEIPERDGGGAPDPPEST